MSKPLLFYMIEEHKYNVKHCKKEGFKPYKIENKSIDQYHFEQVVQYIKDDYIYEVLEGNQCFTSDNMIVLMRLPKLSYEELINTALYSKELDERIGAVGIILKDYPKEFERYLLLIKCNNDDLPEEKEIKRMVILINDLISKNTSYVWPLKKILSLCEELIQKFNNMHTP